MHVRVVDVAEGMMGAASTAGVVMMDDLAKDIQTLALCCFC